MPSVFARPHQMLRPLLSTLVPTTAPRFLKLISKPHRPDLDVLSKRILLPSLPIADEDMTRQALWEQGRKLARQGIWQTLSDKVRLADAARLSTSGGMSEATLLAMGAHADVVASASDSLLDLRAPDPAGLQALEDILNDYPGDEALALVVALAHIRIARAWKMAGRIPLSPGPQTARTHLHRARDLLASHDAEALDAPSLAAANCALAELLDPSVEPIIASYRNLIGLDPDCIQNFRTYGPALLNADGADPALLDQEARYTCDQTRDIWGAGAYVWVQVDALAKAPSALAHLDVELFVQGLRDILKLRNNQYIVNDLAAFCALSMAPRPGLPKAAEAARAQLHGCLSWILERHLQELHPRLWAGTDLSDMATIQGSGQRALVLQGRQAALHSIAAFFADYLADGSTIAFSPAGMYRLPAI